MKPKTPVGTVIRRTLLAAPLLTLFFVAFNFIGSLFWFAGFFIFVAALWHLLRELRKSRRRAPLLALSFTTVALFFGACMNHGRAFGSLSRETRALAEEVQALCVKDNACPSEATVCTPGAYACREAGSLGIQLPIRYRVAADAQSFTVSSSMMSDDATVYEGGVLRPLTRRHLIDGVDEDEAAGATPQVIVEGTYWDAGTSPPSPSSPSPPPPGDADAGAP